MALRVAGEFNVYNALAAAACTVALNVNMTAACEALSTFTGAHRRFELTGVIDGVKLYHDYGHNPVEMRNVLSIAKLQPHQRLWAVMQPHTYSRVKKMLPEYFTCTQAADITLVTDILRRAGERSRGYPRRTDCTRNAGQRASSDPHPNV